MQHKQVQDRPLHHISRHRHSAIHGHTLPGIDQLIHHITGIHSQPPLMIMIGRRANCSAKKYEQSLRRAAGGPTAVGGGGSSPVGGVDLDPIAAPLDLRARAAFHDQLPTWAGTVDVGALAAAP